MRRPPTAEGSTAQTSTAEASTAEVHIESIATGGDGVGRVGPLVVFVPRAAPGDVVRVELEARGRFARGRILELVAPSPARVPPRCDHYVRDQCGGCQLQHLQYEAQLAAKGTIIRDTLQRIGHRASPPVEVRASPANWRYRRKLTLALRRRGKCWIAGLHPHDHPRRVFPLVDCPIADDRIVAVWHEILAVAHLLPRERALRGAVRLASGFSFVLEGGTVWSTSADFFAELPVMSAIWWTPTRGARRLVHARAQRAALGSNAAFGQVNAPVATAMGRHILERALAYQPRSAIDAYAGVGDTAVALAEAGVTTVAVERDADAAAWCAGRLPTGSRAIAARVEDVLAALLPSDTVLLNPPRGGVDTRVTTLLERSEPRPRVVLYTSCHPATLARDLARLPAYAIRSLAAFDMFPQTAHVETVCELVPRPA